LWDAILPCELLVLRVELARVDALLDDPVFFAPFAAYSMPGWGGRRSRWKPICG
jgi:IS5 family transposase